MTLQNFDSQVIMQTVRDRIRASFCELVPEEAWTGLIQKEVDNYFKPKDKARSYNYQESDFSSLVQAELNAYVREKIKEMLNSPEWMEKWNNKGKMEASKAIQDMLVDRTPEIVNKIFADIFQQAINQFRMQLR